MLGGISNSLWKGILFCDFLGIRRLNCEDFSIVFWGYILFVWVLGGSLDDGFKSVFL